MAEGFLQFEERRGYAAMAYWARIAKAAPTYGGLAASSTSAIMSRSAPGPLSPTAHLHQNRRTL